MSRNGPGRSLWLEAEPGTRATSPFEDGNFCDVVVIGAGIAGLTTAYLLTTQGCNVVVVDAEGVGRGVTGHTTAKVTALQGTVYSSLIDRWGVERATTYAHANSEAVDFIRSAAGELGVSDIIEDAAAITYAADDDHVAGIEAEVEAAVRCGLPAEFVVGTELPFQVPGAVRLQEQLQFHPYRYLVAMAAAIEARGARIFEQTRIVSLEEGTRPRVSTEDGRTIEAGDVVVATNMPIFDRGLFFTKVHPHRSYVVTMESPFADITGMYINHGGPTRSIRSVPASGGRLLMVGGAGHRTGTEDKTSARYSELISFGQKHFNGDEVSHAWSTQDCMSVDEFPYVGRLRRSTPNVFVATGFNKWGMTNGTAAAMQISAQIAGRDDPWKGIFDAKRLAPAQSVADFVASNATAGRYLVGDTAIHGMGSADSLQPGEGGIVRRGLKRVAAFRDDDGSLRTFSARCTHLGCLVHYNEAEKSFDCPCHGSRFDRFGRVLQGPATRDLSPELPSDD